MATSYDSQSSPRCFRPSRTTAVSIGIYACIVLLLAVYIGIMVALCVVRRKTGPGKRLIGLPYIFALFFTFIDQAIQFLSSTLRACEVSLTVRSMYSWNIAGTVFYGMHAFLLLFVVIYILNTMLRKQLGHNPSGLKNALGLILLVMGGLLLSYVAIQCYLYNAQMDLYRGYTIAIDYSSPVYIGLAFDALVIISMLFSGALSIIAARSLKKTYNTSNSLVAWISVLVVSMVGNSMISIIQASFYFSSYLNYTVAGVMAMYYIAALLRALAFISIIVIAKNAAWKASTTVASTGETQYAYNYQVESQTHGGAGQRV